MSTTTSQAADIHEKRKHAMTEFKPGNRVQWRDKDGILHRGTVDDVYDDCVYGTRDGGGRFVAGPWDLTLCPFAFEDVRDGDTITVEVQPFDHPPYSISGVALVRGSHVGIPGTNHRFHAFGPGWVDTHARKATLTAHTPAEPEWHRAKVIKADADYGDGDPETGRLPTQRHGGVFLASTRVPGEFLDQAGNELTPDAFTNVTIIVDEYGKVPAEAAALAGDERKEAH